MFSSLFLDHCRNRCTNKQLCPQNFDFYIDCNNDRYGVEKVKGLHNRVISIRIFKFNGGCFEPFQKFSACQFHGNFFANIRMCGYFHDSVNDIVADVYDADSFPVGTVVLTNNCCTPQPLHSSSDSCDSPHHHHQRPPYTAGLFRII